MNRQGISSNFLETCLIFDFMLDFELNRPWDGDPN